MNILYNKISWKTAAIILLISAGKLYGGADETNSISFFLLATKILGGMGMFLYGIHRMSDGMKVTASNSMRSI
jgi:hypothetical protein